LKELLQFVADVKLSGLELEEPFFATPVEPSDKIVGKVPPNLCAFYLLLWQKMNTTSAKGRELGCDDYWDLEEKLEDCQPYEEEQIKELMVEIDFHSALEELFWVQLERLFPEIVAEQNVQIREKWQIVIFQRSKNSENDEDEEEDWESSTAPKSETVRFAGQSDINRSGIIC